MMSSRTRKSIPSPKEVYRPGVADVPGTWQAFLWIHPANEYPNAFHAKDRWHHNVIPAKGGNPGACEQAQSRAKFPCGKCPLPAADGNRVVAKAGWGATAGEHAVRSHGRKQQNLRLERLDGHASMGSRKALPFRQAGNAR